VIPQNQNSADYFRAYGEFFYQIFSALDIFDMYHSWWFQSLLLLLTINIIVCSIDRLSATWKIIFVKIPPFNISRFRNLSDKEEFADNRSPENLKKIYEPFISKSFSYLRSEATANGICIFAEKGRWTRMGVYTVHLSIVLMLLGGLIGSIFGFEGFVTIPEGEKKENIRIRSTQQLHKLDFEIQCDDFTLSFYDSGAPKEYRSSLTILENDKPVLQKDIIVNDPLRYKNINIFQSSYGTLLPKEFSMNFMSKETGMRYTKNASIGEQMEIPEGMGTLVIKDYSNSYSFMGHNIGESFMGILTPNDGDPVQIILPLRFPQFDKMRKGKWVISVADYKPRYYTGLQVTMDPGVWVVYSGFIMIIIGCFITFFMSHQRLCIEVKKSGKKYKIMVAGTSNKNKLGMQNNIKRITENLSKLK